MKLSKISLLVNDYDEALAYYRDKLGFELVEDTQLSPDKRWVVVSPSGSECSLLLAKAKNSEEAASVGNQSGGRVFLFLETDDFWNDYESFKANGIDFVEEPREESYGTVVVFKDLYGNKWDLVGRR